MMENPECCENMQGAGDPGFKDREDELQRRHLSPPGRKDSHHLRTMYALPRE